jgi:hypothetical protein
MHDDRFQNETASYGKISADMIIAVILGVAVVVALLAAVRFAIG